MRSSSHSPRPCSENLVLTPGGFWKWPPSSHKVPTRTTSNGYSLPSLIELRSSTHPASPPLTYRNNEFVTVLAPLRDLLLPQDPMPSLLFSRWIVLEDVNVEHLLDALTSVDVNSHEAWEACANFTNHIYLHKPQPTVLRQKMEGLPDNHLSKLGCLVELTKLFHSVGNHVERKRLLNHVLELQRGGGGRRECLRLHIE